MPAKRSPFGNTGHERPFATMALLFGNAAIGLWIALTVWPLVGGAWDASSHIWITQPLFILVGIGVLISAYGTWRGTLAARNAMLALLTVLCAANLIETWLLYVDTGSLELLWPTFWLSWITANYVYFLGMFSFGARPEA
jgi:hypothetical protein